MCVCGGVCVGGVCVGGVCGGGVGGSTGSTVFSSY